MSGVPAEIAEATIQSYQQQVAEMAGVIQSRQAILNQRAEPLATAVLDTLKRWCEWAETPGHPFQQNSRNLVDQWKAVHDRMQRITSGIVLPPGHQNGSGAA